MEHGYGMHVGHNRAQNNQACLSIENVYTVNLSYLAQSYTEMVKWLVTDHYFELCIKCSTVADLGGVPRVPWNPPFGFSCDRKLWKPGLQQNPTI